MEQILLAYGIPKETVAAITILYRNTKVKVRSPDGDTEHQLYGHLPPITKTIQVRRTRHAGHCWRIRDELISDVLLWTPTHGDSKAGRPARTYIQQLCEDTGCCPEDLPEAMNDREKWRERVRDIHATSTTWWWSWWWPHSSLEQSVVSLFNGILSFVGYLMSKPYLLKNSSCTIELIAEENKSVYAF